VAVVLLETSNFYVRFIPDPTKSKLLRFIQLFCFISFFKDHFDSDDLEGYENTVVFLISSFQYIVSCLAMSMGGPWRKRTL
jgi:hypothetical protein